MLGGGMLGGRRAEAVVELLQLLELGEVLLLELVAVGVVRLLLAQRPSWRH